jgi:hypothetical protein
MQLKFQLPHKIINLYVDLIDNPGVQAWYKFFGNGYEARPVFHEHLYVADANFERLNQLYQQITDLLTQLKHMGIVYQGLAAVEFDTKNSDNIHHWLNALHRFFTHNQQACNLREFDNDFDYSVASTLLHELNAHIHAIDLYVPQGPADIPVSSIPEIRHWHAYDRGCLDLTDYGQYHSQQHYDIILSHEILGKTILQSYLDLDNPNDWDTSGHYTSAGGIQICIDSTRQTIYQSQSFQNWLTKYGVDPAVVKYDYPLGNIRNKNSAEWHELVEFFNTTIGPSPGAAPDPKIKVTYL